MLEGGNEERMVIDVLVRDGRPVEPNDAASDVASPLDRAGRQRRRRCGRCCAACSGTAIASRRCRYPSAARNAKRTGGCRRRAASTAATGRAFVGAGAAVAAVVASRQPAGSWAAEVDEAAEAIGRARLRPAGGGGG